MDDQLQLISASSFKFSCKNGAFNISKDNDWFCGFMKNNQGLVLLDNNWLNLGLNWFEKMWGRKDVKKRWFGASETLCVNTLTPVKCHKQHQTVWDMLPPHCTVMLLKVLRYAVLRTHAKKCQLKKKKTLLLPLPFSVITSHIRLSICPPASHQMCF